MPVRNVLALAAVVAAALVADARAADPIDAALVRAEAAVAAILARGGEVDGLDLVRGFLGREPDSSAYLDHLGLSEGR